MSSSVVPSPAGSQTVTETAGSNGSSPVRVRLVLGGPAEVVRYSGSGGRARRG